MLQNVHPLLSYFYYWLKKEDKYSLQSPLLFKTYQGLIHFKYSRKEADLDIEAYRKTLLNSEEIIKVTDFGAGSKRVNTSLRKVSDITKFSTSSRKYAQLYQYFCSLTPARTVLELGTCMGISTRYLSKVTKGSLFSFEGSEEIARVAKPTQGFDNIQIHIGDLSEMLPVTLGMLEEVDFALIDATHTYEGTIEYFNQILSKVHSKTILAIGDIHWSKEMELAWNEIKLRPEVKLSLDFYECGIVFFNYPGSKSEYVLDY